MSIHAAHVARLRTQLERAIALSLRPAGPKTADDRLVALLGQQRDAIADAMQTAKMRGGREVRLLVIERDAALCGLYSAMAEAFGIECDSAADVLSVMSTKHAASHALVVADWHLADAIAEGLEQLPRPKLLLTAASEELVVARESPLLPGALGMLLAPFELEPLMAIVTHWMLRRLVLSS
ncbi:MAG: hypothetical protein JOZ54_17555 [Acidobacteria bacterium]|nr:hypothetical protein [Acidobacteriota bacterium]